jgi:hypothetical protein
MLVNRFRRAAGAIDPAAHLHSEYLLLIIAPQRGYSI